MTELLQFMYQGVVNVKHTELNSFMKIAQALQIKGLATSSTSNQQLHHHQSHHHTQKSPASPMSNIATSSKNPLDAYGNAAALFHSSPLIGQKRAALDYAIGHNSGEPSVPAAKKHLKRSSDSVDNDISTESMENMSSDDGFPIPQISMIESGRFDLSNVKRETSEPLSSPGSTRNLQSSFNFEYNSAYNIFQFILEWFTTSKLKIIFLKDPQIMQIRQLAVVLAEAAAAVPMRRTPIIWIFQPVSRFYFKFLFELILFFCVFTKHCLVFTLPLYLFNTSPY